MRFSTRSRVSMRENRWSRARRVRAPELDLTQSNPTRSALPVLPQEAREALAHADVADYAPYPLGAPAARATVAAELSVEADDVCLCASTSEAYGLLFTLLCDPGDVILAPQPSYPLLAQLAPPAGIRLAPYPLAYDGEWHVREVPWPERTRAALVVSPNNPTGHYLRNADHFRELPLIVDEVFGAYPLESEPVRAWRHARGLRFVLGGLSKHCGMPQMKLAWIVLAGPGRDEAKRRLAHLADAGLNLGTPVQSALPALLRAGAPIREAIRRRLAANLAALRAALVESPFSVPRVEGGWYACIRVPRVESDENHAISLLGRGVLVHPGYFYDFDEGWLVVSLLTPEPVFAEGVARIAEYGERWG